MVGETNMNIVKISDGLGNQMFQYAFARKLQIETGKVVYLDTRFINNEDVTARGEQTCRDKKNADRKYGLEHFRIRLPQAGESVLKPWSYLTENDAISQSIYRLAQAGLWPWQYRDEETFDVKKGAFLPTYYKGYFFDLSYFDSIKDVLQREFVLKEKMRLPGELSRLLRNEDTISIHVRRGDFLKLNRDISQKEYYPKTLAYMSKVVSQPTYLVFSDDIEWVREHLEIPGEKIYVSEMGFQDYEEMAIMKHCKHHIIANSTFSYWPAYLNANPDKVVVCPKNWKTDIIPKQWVSI